MYSPVKPRRQHADDLPAVGVPERDRIDDGAGAERGDEAVDPRDLDEEAVEQPEQAAGDAARSATAIGQGRPVLGLQGDGQDVPEHDAVADGQVDPAGHHRDHRRQRQHAR